MDRGFDFWASLQAQEKMSKATDERRASVHAALESINRFSSFVKNAADEEERDLRLDLVDKDVRRLAELFAEKHEVEVEPVYSYAKERLAAEVAVTEPKKVDPEKGIGEETHEGGPDRFADDETDVNSLESVMEEDGIDNPKRHKKEQVDLNKDTQKAPKASASVKEAAPTMLNEEDEPEWGGPSEDYPYTAYYQKPDFSGWKEIEILDPEDEDNFLDWAWKRGYTVKLREDEIY